MALPFYPLVRPLTCSAHRSSASRISFAHIAINIGKLPELLKLVEAHLQEPDRRVSGRR